MRAVLALAVLAAGCASHDRPTGSATVTLFGPESRLDAWTTSVVEGIHVHAFEPEQPCVAAGMSEILEAATGVVVPERRLDMKQMSVALDTMMESMLVTSNGPAHGGRGRAVLALRRADEALVVDLPRLRPEEKDRLFRAGDVKATYWRPPRTPAARLARGWVRAVRLDSGSMEYELFLVLTPERPDAGYETMQVITRVAWPPR